MNLLNYCKENNICCGTCALSYKNYISDTSYNLYCGSGGSLVNEKSVCLDYYSKD